MDKDRQKVYSLAMNCVIKRAILCLVCGLPLAAQEHYYLPTPTPPKKQPEQSKMPPKEDDISGASQMHNGGEDGNALMPPASNRSALQGVIDEADMVRFDGGAFTIGEDSQTYTAKRKVLPFLMNKYEVTYSLWYKVRLESEKRGYVLLHPGQEGTAGRRAKMPTAAGAKLPVTMISWYDAVVWCNALSEVMGLEPCYTYKGAVLRDASDTASCDLCECDWEKDGYRLPSEAEWEYAARYSPAGIRRGDKPSGEDDRGNAAAWTAENTREVHTVGTALTMFGLGGVLPEAGSGVANGAGLFDMSGNALEYCWDWFAEYSDDDSEHPCGPQYGDERVSRGGSISPYTSFVSSGDRYAYDPNEYYNYMGFRVARTAK